MDEGADFLRDDPRTAWAYRSYLARRDAEGMSAMVGRRLLEALDSGDHAELIADAVATDLTDIRQAVVWHRDDAEPVVAMRTLRKWVLVDREEGLVITVDGEADRGVSGTTAYGTPRPDIGWAATLETPDEGLFTMKVFLGDRGGVEETVIESGAGAHIRRLPEADAVPPIPDAAAILGTASPTATVTLRAPTRPAPMLPADWRTAEDVACAHLHTLGFGDAEVTPGGRDGGLDVTARDAVAQVKMMALPVGAPPVQQLRGTRPLAGHHLFYSTSGYTAAAVTAADEIDVALFKIERDGSVTEVNEHAITLLRAGTPLPEEPDVTTDEGLRRYVTAYAEAVAARILAACHHVDHERARDGERFPGQWERMAGYLRKALDNLAGRPTTFPSLRAAMVYFHHTELLAHVFFQEFGISYPDGARRFDDDLDSYYT
ncbi:restriction endonuclease [Actinoplanes sp. NPDC023801]|uniref:restriction endonuclease n=1 Tax=Actinoplanes sp. NPDC023801 TaxID=3154595 RepID=UPI0033D5D045